MNDKTVHIREEQGRKRLVSLHWISYCFINRTIPLLASRTAARTNKRCAPGGTTKLEMIPMPPKSPNANRAISTHLLRTLNPIQMTGRLHSCNADGTSAGYFSQAHHVLTFENPITAYPTFRWPDASSPRLDCAFHEGPHHDLSPAGLPPLILHLEAAPDMYFLAETISYAG